MRAEAFLYARPIGFHMIYWYMPSTYAKKMALTGHKIWVSPNKLGRFKLTLESFHYIMEVRSDRDNLLRARAIRSRFDTSSYYSERGGSFAPTTGQHTH